MPPTYDALLLVSFGGPEHRDEVLPFLERVVRGRGVPHQRLLEVAEHYYHFDGISPINAQNRALLAALRAELVREGIDLPLYFGNRNGRPYLVDTTRQMARDGVRRALALVTSAFGSYSGCRQYLENIDDARRAMGESAPRIDKLRLFYNHPGFLEAQADRVREALAQLPPPRQAVAHLRFTAHSIPTAMAAAAPYERQLRAAATWIAKNVGQPDWRLVYQSRSGPASQPWLEPDVCDELRQLGSAPEPRDVVLVPLGFLSDHLEVLYDLDVEARQVANDVGLKLIRAETVGTHPRFIAAIRDLIVERLDPTATRLALGDEGPWPDICPPGCCPRPQRPPSSDVAGMQPHAG